MCSTSNSRPHIFVFGSNLAGRHGKGAALYARENYGAKYGVGHGRTGYSYAIPTKDYKLKTLPLDAIKIYVGQFIEYAKDNPQLNFMLTPIGTGLAGYTHSQIAPMFCGCPSNVEFPEEWSSWRLYRGHRR